MSDRVGIRTTKDGITDFLQAMLGRATGAKAGFARGVYPLYQKLQMKRFQTKNASEGAPWDPLNPEYATYKLRRYGGGPRRKSAKRPAGTWQSYPGGGTKMMMGTTMLAGAVIGPGGGVLEGTGQHRALFTDDSMVISVEESGTNPDGTPFTYPHHAAEHRPFMTFSNDSITQMKAVLRSYILGQDVETSP